MDTTDYTRRMAELGVSRGRLETTFPAELPSVAIGNEGPEVRKGVRLKLRARHLGIALEDLTRLNPPNTESGRMAGSQSHKKKTRT